MSENKTLIESPNFPIEKVNKASQKEKGPGRPDYWEMVFWWTRKPLIGARSIILASLIPENTNPQEFEKWVKLNTNKTPHRQNPELPPELKEQLKNKKILDPSSGFGSIPLEAIRLGIGEVVAVELLPTAHIFLKAILEYPTKYGKLKTKTKGEEIKKLGLETIAKNTQEQKTSTQKKNTKYQPSSTM